MSRDVVSATGCVQRATADEATGRRAAHDRAFILRDARIGGTTGRAEGAGLLVVADRGIDLPEHVGKRVIVTGRLSSFAAKGGVASTASGQTLIASAGDHYKQAARRPRSACGPTTTTLEGGEAGHALHCGGNQARQRAAPMELSRDSCAMRKELELRGWRGAYCCACMLRDAHGHCRPAVSSSPVVVVIAMPTRGIGSWSSPQ